MAEEKSGAGVGKTWKGLPIGVWAVVGAGGVGTLYFLWKRRGSAAASAPAAATPSPAPSGMPASSDQTQAIYADIRNLQGQETGFSNTATSLQNTLGSQIQGVATQVSQIPAGPAGPAGPSGTPGQAGPPAPVSRPAPPPIQQEAKVTSNGTYSLANLAAWNNSSVAGILAHTRNAEPSDSYSTTSRLYKYFTAGRWNDPIPKGYVIWIPVGG